VPATHLAHGSQKDIPENLGKRNHHGDTEARRTPA
jgi:hypothetical protein